MRFIPFTSLFTSYLCIKGISEFRVVEVVDRHVFRGTSIQFLTESINGRRRIKRRVRMKEVKEGA